jgi:hypothetical protein
VLCNSVLLTCDAVTYLDTILYSVGCIAVLYVCRDYDIM